MEEKKNFVTQPQTFRLVLVKKEEKIMDEKKNEPRTPSRGEINKIYTENALRQDAKIREEQRKHAKDNWQGRTR